MGNSPHPSQRTRENGSSGPEMRSAKKPWESSSPSSKTVRSEKSELPSSPQGSTSVDPSGRTIDMGPAMPNVFARYSHGMCPSAEVKAHARRTMGRAAVPG
eukprot:Amastigsp_a340160_18.p5 type:complete len:101 gc:universal Amastigsp_a340160_18:414-112(-)